MLTDPVRQHRVVGVIAGHGRFVVQGERGRNRASKTLKVSKRLFGYHLCAKCRKQLINSQTASPTSLRSLRELRPGRPGPTLSIASGWPGSPEHEHADAGDQCNSTERCHRSECDLDAAHVLHGLRGSPERRGKVISLGVKGTREWTGKPARLRQMSKRVSLPPCWRAYCCSGIARRR